MSPLTDIAASTVVAAHIGYFLFVVASSVAIIFGGKNREWIRNPWFRFANLAAVFIVIAEDVFGWQCPLNTLEWNLRTASGVVTPSPVGRLLEFLLRETIPGWALHAMYWLLGLLLVMMLFLKPPRFRRRASYDADRKPSRYRMTSKRRVRFQR